MVHTYLIYFYSCDYVSCFMWNTWTCIEPFKRCYAYVEHSHRSYPIYSKGFFFFSFFLTASCTVRTIFCLWWLNQYKRSWKREHCARLIWSKCPAPSACSLWTWTERGKTRAISQSPRTAHIIMCSKLSKGDLKEGQQYLESSWLEVCNMVLQYNCCWRGSTSDIIRWIRLYKLCKILTSHVCWISTQFHRCSHFIFRLYCTFFWSILHSLYVVLAF